MPLAILFMAFLVLLAAFWTWVIVRAGRWGASIGERHRIESTPDRGRLRAIDPSRVRRGTDSTVVHGVSTSEPGPPADPSS